MTLERASGQDEKSNGYHAIVLVMLMICRLLVTILQTMAEERRRPRILVGLGA